jgi:hypothetical protein
MGSPAIRHLATVGGNLCNASPAADLPPVLLTLDAEIEIVGPSGPRRLPLDRFFRGPGQTALAPGEILAWIEFPRRHAGWALRYERLDAAARWTSPSRGGPRSGATASVAEAWRRRGGAGAAPRRRPRRRQAGGLHPAIEGSSS